MPPPLLFDITTLDPTRLVVTKEQIYQVIPQRYEMEQLSGILYISADTSNMKIVGFKDVAADEFWVRGHIPGRPLLPGVLMIECAAQLCAYYTMKTQPEMGFVGFAKCDETRFRGTVVPPTRLYMVAQMVELGRRRCVAKCQGFNNGQMVFESVITGMSV